MKWKWINGYEGFYDIDKRGNVRRHYQNGNIVALTIHEINGCDVVHLCVNSVTYARSVDKLLFETHGITYRIDEIRDSKQQIESKKSDAWQELKQTELYKQLMN